MNDEGFPHLGGELDLRLKSGALFLAGRVVVVIVETALADRDGAGGNALFEQRNVARTLESLSVVGMDAGGEKHEPRVGPGDLIRSGGRRKRLADADNPLRAR